MTNVAKQIETASQTGHLVLVMFYADWSPHYEWLESILLAHEKRVIELFKVDIEENKALADSMNVKTVPAFVLLHNRRELWRQVGELTVDEFKDVLNDFR